MKPLFYINAETCIELRYTLGAACPPRGQRWGEGLSLEDDTLFPKAKQWMA